VSQPVTEIVPGVLHWTAQHPNIGADVSSYYLVAEGALTDPMAPPDGWDAVSSHGEPAEILLSNRHHRRDALVARERFGVPVRCHSAGMHEFGDDEHVEPFEFGDVLANGVEAHEVGVICPEETALLGTRCRALVIADAVINYGGLQFVPDEYIGDDPEAIKRGVKRSLARISELDFDHLLLAHGEPVIGDGPAVLRRFAES
jgi:hypothetical protein